MKEHIFRAFRNKHGLSQADLGEMLKLGSHPQGRISHIETGLRPLSIEVAKRFQLVAAEYGETYTLERIYPNEAA